MTTTFPQPQRPDQVYDPGPTGVAPGGRAGILRARKVIIVGTGSELLVYSPTAGFGHLVASIVPGSTPTTDSYGNVVLPGIVDYFPNESAVQLVNSQLTFYTFSGGSWVSLSIIQNNPGVADWAPTVTGQALQIGSASVAWKVIEQIAAQTLLVPSGTPSAATSQLLEVQGGQAIVLPTTGTALEIDVTGDADFRFTVSESGRLQWGSGSAALDTNLYRAALGTLQTDDNLRFNASAAANNVIGSFVTGDTSNRWQSTAQGTMVWGTGTAAGDTDLFRQSPARLTINDVGFVNNYTLTGHQLSDFTKFTSTATAFVQVAKNWTIPANDAQVVGATYQTTAAGTGRTGTTANSLQFGVAAGPTLTFPNTFATTAAAFSWETQFTLKLITTGTTGTCDMTVTATLGPSGGVALTSTQTTTGVAFNTTGSFGMEMESAWGTVSGTPTLTGQDSMFGRLA